MTAKQYLTHYRVTLSVVRHLVGDPRSECNVEGEAKDENLEMSAMITSADAVDPIHVLDRCSEQLIVS